LNRPGFLHCSWAHVGLGRSAARYVSNHGAIEFHYFFMRKFWMAYKCMGLVVMPGGPCLAASCLTLEDVLRFVQLMGVTIP
jgi:hypothetical protein